MSQLNKRIFTSLALSFFIIFSLINKDTILFSLENEKMTDIEEPFTNQNHSFNFDSSELDENDKNKQNEEEIDSEFHSVDYFKQFTNVSEQINDDNTLSENTYFDHEKDFYNQIDVNESDLDNPSLGSEIHEEEISYQESSKQENPVPNPPSSLSETPKSNYLPINSDTISQDKMTSPDKPLLKEQAPLDNAKKTTPSPQDHFINNNESFESNETEMNFFSKQDPYNSSEINEKLIVDQEIASTYENHFKIAETFQSQELANEFHPKDHKSEALENFSEQNQSHNQVATNTDKNQLHNNANDSSRYNSTLTYQQSSPSYYPQNGYTLFVPFEIDDDEVYNDYCTPPAICCMEGCFDVFISHLEGRGIGYNQGYTTLGLFAAPIFNNSFLQPFIDARAHIFNNGKWAANLGAGLRFPNYCLNKVFGFNAYYDYREDFSDYHQLGLGFEMFGDDFDFRLNGYIPLGNRNKSHLVDEVLFRNRNLLRFYEGKFSLGGFDAEIETSLGRWIQWCWNWNPYIAVGGYYFQHKNERVRGGKIRFGFNYLDYLLFEIRGTFDNVFHSNVQGLISLNIPFGGCSNYCSDCGCCSYTNVCWPVQRQDMIVLDKKCCWNIRED